MRSPFLLFLCLCNSIFVINSYLKASALFCKYKNLYMTLPGKAFLTDKSADLYLNTCLRRSIESCNLCLKDKKSLIEVEFPVSRKSDLSVSETLDTNRKFVREFAKNWASLGKDLWIVFPDAKECTLARKSIGWSGELPFTLTSIESALKANIENIPKLIIAVNPGSINNILFISRLSFIDIFLT